MIELKGLIHGTMVEIRCEDEHVCVFVRMVLPEFEVTHKQGCPDTCRFNVDCKIENVGAV